MSGSDGQGERTGKRVQGCINRTAQVRAVRPDEFTQAKRQVFLNSLAATCNVTTAARAAGISKTTANRLRRGSPAFAQLWEEALDMGYRHLEEQLLAHAIEGVDALVIDPDAAPVPPLPPLAEAGDATPVGTPGAGTAGRRGSAGGIGLAAGAGAGVLSGRGLPVAYQLALLILSQRRAAKGSGPVNHRRKALTTQEVDALLVQKLDRLDRLDAARAARAAAAPGSGSTESRGVGDAA